MYDETERAQRGELATLRVIQVPEVGSWAVQLVVPHSQGPATGWSPFVFWSAAAAELWLSGRGDQRVRPAVRDCTHGPNELAFPAVVDDEGDELLVGEPMNRIHAAGVAALFAAEFRSTPTH